jgi:beta-lactamase class A
LAVDFIEGKNEDASTMCGPLAIAILQSAGLLGEWAQRHDFWLLNPRVNLQPVEDTFPATVYDWFEFKEPVSKFDFAAFPLQAGDLMYLHAGSGGTFEHVLVVSEVDQAGRAFSVTNFFTATSTIIEERMLYDPAQPRVGQFYDWANRSIRNTIGNTGDGGFWIWRVKDGASLEFPGDEASVALRSDLDALLTSAAGFWYGAIAKVNGPLLYQFNPYADFHPASTIKVPVAMAFYDWLEKQNIADWDAFLGERGVQGRTYAQLVRAMLVDSEEDATAVLVDFLGKSKLDALWQSWQLADTHIDPRRASATDILHTLQALHSSAWLTPESSDAILDLMGTHTANDEARLGLLKAHLPAGTRIYNKRGSLVEWPRVVADSGIISLPAGEDYIFTLHGLGKAEAGYEELEARLAEAIRIFGDYLSPQG